MLVIFDRSGYLNIELVSIFPHCVSMAKCRSRYAKDNESLPRGRYNHFKSSNWKDLAKI